ncbi:amidohydrolase family protein [Pedobacter insulae]|uniref:L-fuconolactonase n=1 Tax=Pedobacter insulae TaxID=414048 RepID=A0A1I2YHF2_9SPHI|nr:amidohydrolase family protein [Pedobacter insulae]SFH23991.1 L-fuconolactonase [Pedobacter insulae]
MIDTHVHFWNFDPIRDNWITPDMEVIRRNFLPVNFKKAIESSPITGCIAVQADQSEDENHFLLSLAKEHPVINGIVGWIDLLNPDLEERLAYWQNFKLIKGWRHVLQAENEQFILHPALAKGIQALSRYNYTYDLLCVHSQLPAILKLVERLPGQPLVLDHCGKPDAKTGNLKQWSEHIAELAQHENVYCKVSGLFTEADWIHWKEADIFNCFDVVFKHFGTQRIMYGSDWPVVLLSRPYGDWFNLVQKYCAQFSKAERRMIFYDNASAFYKL